MSSPGDPRLFGTVWADEARKAASDPEAAQARSHRTEDQGAATARGAAHPAEPGLLRSLLRRLTGRR